MTTRVRARWLVAACSVIVVLRVPAVSYADDVENTTPAEATAAIVDAAPAVLEGVADVATVTTGSTAIDAIVAGTDIVVPTDPAAGIVVDPAQGPAVTIGLPSAQSADNAKPVTDGAVVYDNNNGSATVPVVKSDGSVQINTTIASAEAPTTYRYPITVPEGGSLRLNADGSVSVLDAAGDFASGFGVPWAKDAAEQPVATHYELDGTTLVQVVEHRADGVQYPVVADPSWFHIFAGCAGTFFGIQFKRVSTYVRSIGRTVTLLFLAYAAWDCGSSIGTYWGERANDAIGRCWPNCPLWKPFQFW